jgi:hypothetical protein
MEHGMCNVIYIDRRANDEHVRRDTLSDSLVARTSTGNVGQSYFAMGKLPPAEVHANVEAILSMFNEGGSHSQHAQPRIHYLLTLQFTFAAQVEHVYPKSPVYSTRLEATHPPLLS